MSTRTKKPKAHPFDKAAWIWCSRNPDELNQYGLFRRWFSLPSAFGHVRLHACADLRYWLYINGVRVGFGPGRYNEKNPQFDTYDITALVRHGKNLVAFKVHSAGPVRVYVSAIPVRAGLIAAVEWHKGLLVTGSGWRSWSETAYDSLTPRFSAHQSFVENFDARRAQLDWEKPGFKDSHWPDAREFPLASLPPWGKPVHRPVPLLTLIPRTPARILERGISLPDNKYDINNLTTVGEMLENAERQPGKGVCENPRALFPVSLTAPAGKRHAAYAVFDFGENAAGYLVFHVHGKPGTVIDFAYSESFMKGFVEAFAQGVRYHDRLILGREPLIHQLMMPKCLRYLLVEVRSGKADFDMIRQDVSTSPVRWEGSFVCDEMPDLGRVWQIGAYTVQLCMEDIYMDTPRRERTGWLGDMLPEAMAAYYAFGEIGLARHSLELFMSSQFPEGYISGRYPSSSPCNMPTWSASFTPALADYVRYSGDTAFPRELWPGIRRLTGWFENQRMPNDLLVVCPAKQTDAGRLKLKHHGYILVDWAPQMRDGAVTAMDMFYYQYLREAVWLAELIGENEEAGRLRALAQRTKKAIQNLMFEERRGVFVNCRDEKGLSTQAGIQDNLLALLWDIATPGQADRIKAFLLPDDSPLPLYQNPDAKNWVAMGSGDITWPGDSLVPIGSPFFEYYALGALFELGRTTAAINNIRVHYGAILAKGATTVWEEWGGASSHSHGWGAAPTCYAGKYLLGVEPTLPGFKQFSVFPSFGNLHRAGGRVPSPRGTISVKWEIKPGGISLAVTVPPGTQAQAGLPCNGQSRQLIVDGTLKSQPEVFLLRRGRYLGATLKPGRHSMRLVSA